jgi:hypothetical protein
MEKNSKAVRISRIEQVRDFIYSGEQEREITVHENEMNSTVRTSLRNCIASRPFFKANCYVEQRNYRIFLVRRTDDG